MSATSEAVKFLFRAANVWWRCAQYFVIASCGFLIVCYAFRLLPVSSVDVIILSHLLLFSTAILLISSLPVSSVVLSKGVLMYCILYVSYRLYDSSDRPGMYWLLHPLVICFLGVMRMASTNLSHVSGVGSISSIRMSTYDAYPLQFAFLRLSRLLNAVGRHTNTGFTVTKMGRCWVPGIGFRTYSIHMLIMLEDAKMRSGL